MIITNSKDNYRLIFYSILLSTLFIACKDTSNKSNLNNQDLELLKRQPENLKTPKGMVWIPGGVFQQGGIKGDNYALKHEKPAHEVAVDGFFMDITEVTNAQFRKFVMETGYLTVAERNVDWDEMKRQLPEGSPKPHDSLLQPGTLTFMKCHSKPSNLGDYTQWWNWTIGANWKHPKGPESSIEGLDNHPVVQIAYEDALAYCKWADRRLPTEAEWEYAARANNDENKFFWGNDETQLMSYANTWEGEFPVTNTLEDGFERSAPVKSYPPNAYGLYDMAGNVWEWTSDWYNVNYYQSLKNKGLIELNPQGAESAYNPINPNAKEKVIKGGSFLCNASYCASYRISSRMATTSDSSLEHLGFRTVTTINMLKNN